MEGTIRRRKGHKIRQVAIPVCSYRISRRMLFQFCSRGHDWSPRSGQRESPNLPCLRTSYPAMPLASTLLFLLYPKRQPTAS